MKNKINIFLLISFLSALTLTGWCYYQVTNRVGDISFNKETDNSTFKVCDEKKVYQYYISNTNYQNGKRALKKEIWDSIKNITFKKPGYITFRFIINCNGEVGRFRVKTIDSELKTNYVDSLKIRKLQKSIKNLKNWNAGLWNGKAVDSYFVLTFKVKKGKIIDIF